MKKSYTDIQSAIGSAIAKGRVGNDYHRVVACASSVFGSALGVSLSYHYTRVAHRDATTKVITLDDGGWGTKTTKERMNAFLGAFNNWRVYQEDFGWYVDVGDGKVLKFDLLGEGYNLRQVISISEDGRKL